VPVLYPAAAVRHPRAIPNALLAAATLLMTVLPASAHNEPHGAHVHGLARLAVTLDGNLLALMLESPLDNLLGFEHHPRTPEQQEAAARLMATLNAPADLFTPTAAADCVPVRVAIESPLLAAPAGTHDGQHEHDHKHDHDHEHDHDPAHDHDPEHDHERYHEHSHGHADLYAEFDFECAQVAELRGMSVELFSYFPRLERINAEVAVRGGQTAVRLDARNRELGWR
jgi:hypothetical protein